MTTTENYYNDKYFDWQAPIGEFGGWANLTKFQPFTGKALIFSNRYPIDFSQKEVLIL